MDCEVTSRYAGFGLGFAILASLGLISLGARWQPRKPPRASRVLGRPQELDPVSMSFLVLTNFAFHRSREARC